MPDSPSLPDSLIGKTLPTLTLDCSTGKPVQFLNDLKGHWTLLYFYPKDDTPGCTRQACGYRDQLKDFQKNGITIYGVSRDDLPSHEKFIKKYQLNFPLLSDPESKLGSFLGASHGKSTSRDSFLIDPEGKVKEVWRKVRPDKTVQETLSGARGHL